MAEEETVKNALTIRDFSRVIITLDNCLVPDDKLSPTPSEQDGLSSEVEIDLRVLGCELIQTSGILLKLPQVAMASAQVLFQRFYYSKSLVKHNMEVVAMACINLASKIEEDPRRMRDVINVFHHIKQVKSGKTIIPLILDQNYINLKNQVIKAERRVLKELGFCVHVKHPHKMIVMYLKTLECERNQRLVQNAWNYMNDSFRTNVFVRYPPESIACACIYLAARRLQFCLPNNPAWYELFDAREEDLKSISIEILKLYKRKKPNADKLEAAVNEVKKVHIEARLKAKGLNSASPSSRPGTPSKVDSPLSGVKKIKNEEARSEASFGHNQPLGRKRSHSPDSRDSRSPKSRSRSRSRSYHSSRSVSRSPQRKRFRTPTRKQKERARERDEYRRSDKDHNRYIDKYSKKKRSKDQDYYENKDPRDNYYDSRDYKRSSKQALVDNRGRSETPEYKNKKKYYKEKRERRTRSRSLDRYEAKRKSKKHANGHRRSRTPERYRRERM